MRIQNLCCHNSKSMGNIFFFVSTDFAQIWISFSWAFEKNMEVRKKKDFTNIFSFLSYFSSLTPPNFPLHTSAFASPSLSRLLPHLLPSPLTFLYIIYPHFPSRPVSSFLLTSSSLIFSNFPYFPTLHFPYFPFP